MMDWLQVDSWQEILALGGVAVLALTLTLAMVKGEVTLPGGTVLRLGGARGKRKLPPHATCPHAADIMSVIARTSELVERRHLSRYEALEAQMRYFEERSADIKAVVLKGFASALDDKGIAEPAEHPDYANFHSALKVVLAEIQDSYRLAMRRNHFIEMNQEKWKAYKDDKAALYLAITTDTLNLHYRGSLITRAEQRRITHVPATLGRYREILDECFDFALAEAHRVADEIAAHQEAYEKWLKKDITG